jgi:hypothetical protein
MFRLYEEDGVRKYIDTVVRRSGRVTEKTAVHSHVLGFAVGTDCRSFSANALAKLPEGVVGIREKNLSC